MRGVECIPRVEWIPKGKGSEGDGVDSKGREGVRGWSGRGPKEGEGGGVEWIPRGERE